MFDYHAWTMRAKRFLRSMSWLPGELTIGDWIEPPDVHEFHREWLSSERCDLPLEIKEFVSKASSRCLFYYEWRAPDEITATLKLDLPGVTKITGGADFCEQAIYYLNYHRNWFHDFFQGRAPSMSTFTGETKSSGRTKFLPLAKFPTNEALVLEMTSETDRRGSVFLASAQDATLHEISTSFEQFLLDWETICYLTPTMENLQHWLDSSGQLNPDVSRARRLRELLTQNSKLS